MSVRGYLLNQVRGQAIEAACGIVRPELEILHRNRWEESLLWCCLWSKGFKPNGGTWEYSLDGEFTTNASGTTFRKFKFTKIQTVGQTPPNLAIQEKEILSKLGEIVVKVHHITYDNVLSPAPLLGLEDTSNKITETVLKGADLSHTTQ